MPPTPTDARRAHLAALRRELELRRRVFTPDADDARAVLADLYRPRRELGGLSPCAAARAGGDAWRRVLRLYPRRGGGAA